MLRNLLIIALLLGSTCCFAQKGTQDAQTAHYKEIGDPLPPIMVYTLDGKKITNKDIKSDANLFVMLFNPTCSHCEDMTVLLEKNIGLFKKSKVLMVCASFMTPYLKDFETNYHIDQYPTLNVALDSNLHLIDKTFQYKMLPQISVYDKDRKLVKVFTGEIAIDSLKQYIQ
jgi:thiol-disulfide isomerase/thioredoxin